MKKNLLPLLLSLLLIPISVKATDSLWRVQQTTPGAQGDTWENDSIKVSITTELLNWSISIENKTDKIIECVWDKSLSVINEKTFRVVTGETTRYEILRNIPIRSDFIPPNASKKEVIVPVSSLKEARVNFYLFDIREIFETGDNMPVRLILVIKYENELREHEFSFNVSLSEKQKERLQKRYEKRQEKERKKQEKERKKQEKEQEKERKRQEKERKKQKNK